MEKVLPEHTEDDYNNVIHRAQSEVAWAEEELKRLKKDKEHEEHHRDMHKAWFEIDKMYKQRTQLEAKLEKLKKDIENAKDAGTLKNLKAEKDTTVHILEFLNNDINEASLRQIREELNRLQSERAEFQEQKGSIKAEMDGIEKKLHKMN